MINEIKQSIVDKLAELYSSGHTFYLDDVPQNFETPSFLISLFDQDFSKRISNKYKSEVSFDVAFFSDKGKEDIKSDCHEVQENLLREFEHIGSFRAINKNAQITDNVLHIIFDIKYSEMKKETVIPMRTQSTNTNI